MYYCYGPHACPPLWHNSTQLNPAPTSFVTSGGGGGGCHLRVVPPPGQLLRRPSTPKPFIEPGFSIFLTWSFFVFAFRWFRVFHWGCYVYFRIVFSSNSLYILYIFIFIYFIYFFIALVVPYSALTDNDRSVVLTLDDRPDPQLWGHCMSTHNSSMICFLCLQWFLFGILATDGMSERNHCHIIIFFISLF